MTQTIKIGSFSSYSFIGLVLVVLWDLATGLLVLWRVNVDFSEISLMTAFEYYQAYTGKIRSAVIESVAHGFFLTVVPVTWLLTRDNQRPLFGAAKLATAADIIKAGLFASSGLIVGRFNGRLLVFSQFLHVLLSAKTRSGKGVAVIVPSLLVSNNSGVFVDVKEELFGLTSKFRQLHGHEVYYFNPLSLNHKTHRWNPLGYISDDPIFRVNDIQKIGNLLYPDGDSDNIWAENCRLLFMGICLFLAESGQPLNIDNVLTHTTIGGDSIDFFKSQIRSLEESGNPLSKRCVTSLNSYIANESERTRASVMSNFRGKLEPWNNDLMAAATSANDFDLRDIRKKKMSIYLCVTLDNLDRMAPIINLFFQLLLDLNLRELPSHNKDLKYRCDLVIDEARAVGKIPALSKGIAFLAGCGFRLVTVVQSPAQLKEMYGQDGADNYIQNCAMHIVFPPKASDTKVLKDLSESIGYTTEKNESQSKKIGIFSNKLDKSQSTSQAQRALLLPQEIAGLKEGKELIFLDKCPPILADMAYFYKDKLFVDRLKKVSPMLNKIRGLPTEQQYIDAVVAGELAIDVPTITVNQEVYTMQNFDPFEHISEPSPDALDTTVNEFLGAIYG